MNKNNNSPFFEVYVNCPKCNNFMKIKCIKNIGTKFYYYLCPNCKWVKSIREGHLSRTKWNNGLYVKLGKEYK